MKQRPILFKGEMVRAILAGTKNQTRRVVKPQPPLEFSARAFTDQALDINGERAGTAAWFLSATDAGCSEPIFSPYGGPGDQIWVREAYRFVIGYDHRPPRDVSEGAPIRYEADGLGAEQSDGWLWGKQRPSMFMPRWASRITLEITSVRVERLQDITEADALAEGITTVRTPGWDARHFGAWRKEFDACCAMKVKPPRGPLPSVSYRALWEQINGPESWAVNPWVWCVEFKRIKP